MSLIRLYGKWIWNEICDPTKYNYRQANNYKKHMCFLSRGILEWGSNWNENIVNNTAFETWNTENERNMILKVGMSRLSTATIYIVVGHTRSTNCWYLPALF